MSASKFLRGHGWRMRLGLYEHPRMPDVLHSLAAALLQQAQWLEQSPRAAHDGGFSCAQVDEGSQMMAGSVSRLIEERDAALRAYDAEVVGRRDEVRRLHAELRAIRAELSAVALACETIPDITISKWACDPGGHWNRVRDALRERRAAIGLTVDAEDPATAFDEHGWLVARRARRLNHADD